MCGSSGVVLSCGHAVSRHCYAQMKSIVSYGKSSVGENGFHMRCVKSEFIDTSAAGGKAHMSNVGVCVRDCKLCLHIHKHTHIHIHTYIVAIEWQKITIASCWIFLVVRLVNVLADMLLLLDKICSILPRSR